VFNLSCISLFLFGLVVSSNVWAEWQVRDLSDAMTDEKATGVLSVSNSAKQTLIVRCSAEGGYGVYVDWGVYVGDKIRSAEVRFDNDGVEVYKFGSDGAGMVMYSEQVSGFIKRLKSGMTLKVRTENFRGHKTPIAEFDLRGFTRAVTGGCGWFEAEKKLKAQRELEEARRHFLNGVVE